MFFKRLLATKYWLGSRFIPKRAGHYILKYNKLMDEIERERRTAFCVGRINDKANCVTKNKIIPRVPCDYGVLVDGPFATSYSLAECNRSLAKGMLEIGHEASLSDYASQHFATVDDLAANGIDADLAYDRSREIHVYLRNTYPPKVRGMNGEFNAYSCYGWEETRFLPEYVSVFNEKLDAVFTTSNFVTKVLQDSGVTVPVFTVGNGVDNWERAAEQPYEVPHKKFVFLHVSSCFPRKSPEVVVSAYEKAFTCDDDVTLIIKTFKNPHNHITELIEERKAQNPKFPDLRLIEDDLSIGQLKSLVNQSDIAVLPSRGEGFGLPHAQAFLSGIPIVTVNWSGPADFCSKDSAFFVDYKLSKAQSHFAIEQSLWADPDPDHLMRVMKEVVDVPKARLKRMADTGRDIILCTYTWKAVAERIDRVVRNLPDMPAVPALNVGWISSWNVRCGIAEYSSYELINFPVPVTVLACEDVNFAKDGENVVRCWRKYDSLGKLKNVVSEKKFNVVVIQYHPGFFDENELSDLIDYLHGLNSVVVAVLHNTSKLSCLNKLALADRLLVHSIDDVNHLKNIGIVENVALYQLGVYIPEFCRADFYGKIGGGILLLQLLAFAFRTRGCARL